MALSRGSEKSAALERQIGQVSPERVDLFLSTRKSDVEGEKRSLRKRKLSEMEDKILTSITNKELLVGELGFDEGDEDGLLNSEEQETYISSVREFTKLQTNKNYAETCVVFMGMVKSQKVYKALYRSWKLEYENLKSENSDFRLQARKPEHFNQYMQQKSVAYLREVSQALRREKIESLLLGDVDEPEKADQERVKIITLKIEDFITKNAGVLQTAEKVELDELYSEFEKIFTPEDLKGISAESLRTLYDDLVTNIVFEYLTNLELDVISDAMVSNVNSDMTEEEWDQLLRDELLKNATGELKEQLERQSTSSLSRGGSIVFGSDNPDELYEQVSPLTKKSGVVLWKLDENEYLLRFGAFKDDDFQPTISLYGDHFVLHSRYSDEHKDKEYPYDDFTFVANSQILEHEFAKNKEVKAAYKQSIDVNSLIDDALMIEMAQLLFGFDLNEKPLNKMHKMVYGRFIKILLGDTTGTLNERLKAFREFMRKDPENNSVRIVNVLRRQGSEIYTLNGLIDIVRVGGEVKEEGVNV